jgi:PleD family two-component response regulator
MEKHVRKALATVASAGAAAVAKVPSKPFYWSKHGKIMVLSVDDDPTNQMVIENLLTPAGYVVSPCRHPPTHDMARLVLHPLHLL